MSKGGVLLRAGIGAAALAAFLVGVLYGYVCQQRQWPGHSTLGRAYAWALNKAGLPPVRRVAHRPYRPDPPDGPTPPGRWEVAQASVEAAGVDTAHQDAMTRLHTLGYLAGYEPAGGRTGVTVNVPGRAWPGLNLYTSGHKPEATLMDMSGRMLHSWSYPFPTAFPDRPAAADGRWWQETWTRVYPYPNGDLLAIYERRGMIKLDRNSKLIWTNPRGFHHDLFVNQDGLIYALSQEVKIIPRINEDAPVVEDFITILDPGGRVVRNVSLLEAFENSSYASFLDKAPAAGDLMHANTVEVLDGSLAERSPIFRKGNVLTSARELNVIAIVDMEARKVVWALSGQWKAQHHPTLLDNGHILLLDNRGHHGMSKVIEIDPLTQAIEWSYEGTPDNGFYTYAVGANQRLANGNTLITESTAGRAFEVTPDGKIVWQFYNPARAGDKGELIATLFELVRLEPGFFDSWLRSAETG